MNYGVVTDTSVEAKVSNNERRGRKLDHRPNVPGPWVYLVTGDPELDGADSPDYQDDTTFAGAPYDYPAFRNALDGALEWKGHVDVSGATSPATLCTLPVKWRPDHDVSWPTDLLDGANFTIGRVQIDASTGDVTLIWPAS